MRCHPTPIPNAPPNSPRESSGTAPIDRLTALTVETLHLLVESVLRLAELTCDLIRMRIGATKEQMERAMNLDTINEAVTERIHNAAFGTGLATVPCSACSEFYSEEDPRWFQALPKEQLGNDDAWVCSETCAASWKAENEHDLT